MTNLQYTRIRYMLKLVCTLAVLVSTSAIYSQQLYSITQIMDSIETSNPIGKMYDADIRSIDEAARGAKSWMPPEVGAGFFMTPYNAQRWKKMSDMEPGMGSFMLSFQQMFPNRRKLNADASYMQSMSGATRENNQDK